MSAELKRYALGRIPVERPDGDFVRYSDISDYIRDAMRYRHLRNPGHVPTNPFDIIQWMDSGPVSRSGGELDMVLDIAMERSK